MAKVILFANQKGGVGKTTFVIHTAGVLNKYGMKVLVVDMDDQGSSRFHHKNRELQGGTAAFDLVVCRQGFTTEERKKYEGDYDFILVDSPPGVEDIEWESPGAEMQNSSDTSASDTQPRARKKMVMKPLFRSLYSADLVVVPFGFGMPEYDSGMVFAGLVHNFIRLESRKRKITALVVPNCIKKQIKGWHPVYRSLMSRCKLDVAELIVWDWHDYEGTQYAGRTAADLGASKARLLFEKLVFGEMGPLIGLNDMRDQHEKIAAESLGVFEW